MSVYDILYPYQKEAVDRLVLRRRQGLFDEPGTGKTKMALATLEKAGLFQRPSNILVLATQTGAELTWTAEIESATDGIPVTVWPLFKGPLTARHNAIRALADDTPNIVLANHAFMGTKASADPTNPLYHVEWDAVIIDESHLVLPLKVDTTKEMTYFWKGLQRIKVAPSGVRLALSGTPDRGKLEHRYGTWAFLLPERYNSSYPYTKWMYENFIVGFRRFRVRNRVIEQVVPKAVKNQALWNEMEEVMTVRRTKREVAKWLPPKRYIDVEMPLPPALDKAYTKFVFEFDDDGTKKAAEAFFLRAAQFATCDWTVRDVPTPNGVKSVADPIPGSASWKRDWIVDWLQARGFMEPDGAPRVVITSQFAKVLHWMRGELIANGVEPHHIGIIDGAAGIKERLAVQTDFQNGGQTRIILLSMALGDSIDLDAADDLIFIDEVNDPDRVTQTEDRVHRVSRDHHVFIWRLRSRDTMDVVRASTNLARFTTTRRVYDGRRGVDYARQIMARLT